MPILTSTMATATTGTLCSTNDRALDVVYLHGFGETNPGSCKVAREIRKSIPNVTLHTPCYHPQGDYRLTNLPTTIADLDQFIQSTDHKQVVLVGYSVGGFLGALLASAHPELIHVLVMLAPAIDNYERNFAEKDPSEWYMPPEYVQSLIDLPSRPPVDTSAVKTVILHGLKDTDDGGSAPWRVREYAKSIGCVLFEPDCGHSLEPWLSAPSSNDGIPTLGQLITSACELSDAFSNIQTKEAG